MEAERSVGASMRKIHRSRRRPWRRRLLTCVAFSAALALTMVAIAGWLGYKGSNISADLKYAAQLMPQLKTDVLRNDAASAARTLEELESRTARARTAASDPLWSIAGALPWVGANFRAVSEVAISADDVTQLAAAPLVSVLRTLDWKTLLPSGEGADMEPLIAAEPKLSSAAHAIRQSADRLNAIDVDSLLPQVATPLLQAREQLSGVRDGLDAAADAGSLAPAMLGAGGPRNYLLMIQNNAEVRASGGIPGALAVLTFDDGQLSLGRQSAAGTLGAAAPPIAVDPEQQTIYSARMGTYMQDVNLTPDFPTAAATAQALWEKKTGQRVNGVISVDPVALSYLLKATGPVEISDPELLRLADDALPMQLSAQNVVRTLLSDVYAKIPEPRTQDTYFSGVAEEIFTALSTGQGDAKGLIDGIARATAERRILVWSGIPDEQALLVKHPLGGAISGPSISPAHFGVYFNDGTGAKMDFYVKRTVQLIKECTKDGYSQVTVRVTSSNTAPKDAARSLPKYVTGAGAFGVPAGTVQTNIIAYGPAQANVETATVNGNKSGFAAHRHDNRPVGALTLSLSPGETTTVDFTFGKIVQETEPTLTTTPTVQALTDVIRPTVGKDCASAMQTAD